MIQKYASKNTASIWLGHLLDFNLKCKLKNNFGFVLTAKCGFLFVKLNLVFDLKLFYKIQLMIKKDNLLEKMCGSVLNSSSLL